MLKKKKQFLKTNCSGEVWLEYCTSIEVGGAAGGIDRIGSFEMMQENFTSSINVEVNF